MYYILRFFAAAAWVFKKALWIIFLILIFGFFSRKLDNVDKNIFFAQVNLIDRHILHEAKTYLPTSYNHQDISRYVALGVVLILIWILSLILDELLYRARYFQIKKEAKVLGQLANTTFKDKKLEAFKEKFAKIDTVNRQDKKQLLKEFVNIKKQLESMGRDLAFLSVDVVDSTAMKLNEDAYVVSNDFNEYRNFVETRVNANGCIKSTWTPDGLMACFSKLDDAIRAGQLLLKDLVIFNKEIKSMKQDFKIRCGVNSGYLFFDESLPLEQITDRVIDIAGHMQKHAEPNTIFVAKHIIKPVEGMKGFTKTNVDIDGLSAYRWNENDAK